MSIAHDRTTTAGVSTSPRERIIALLKRAAILATGTTGLFYFNQNFDYVAYPYVAIVADSWANAYLGTSLITYPYVEVAANSWVNAYFGTLLITLGVMTIASTLVSLAVIWLHDWTGRDWLGLEGLKEFKDDALTLRFPRIPSPTNWLAIAFGLAFITFFPMVVAVYLVKWIWVHLTRWKYGNAVVYVGFSFYDPVYATIYMRDSTNRTRWFTRRDWAIFFGSIAIGNGLWSLIVAGVAPWAWKYVAVLF